MPPVVAVGQPRHSRAVPARNPQPVRQVCRAVGWVLPAFAGLSGCTPPWYRLLTIEAEGQLLPDARCAADVRGDLTRRFRLPSSAGYVSSTNQPALLPPFTLVVTGGAFGPSPDHSKLHFLIAVRDTVRGPAPGAYHVISDDALAAQRAEPGIATFTATLVPDSADQTEWRHYRALSGALALTAVRRTPNGDLLVTGHFRVRARRYVSFGG